MKRQLLLTIALLLAVLTTATAQQTGDFNKAILTLSDNTEKVYNTASIAGINIDANGLVTVGNDSYSNVLKIYFQKNNKYLICLSNIKL